MAAVLTLTVLALAALFAVSGVAALAILGVVLLANARLQRANARLEQERNDKEDARAEAQENFRQARNAVDEMLRDVGAKQLAHLPQLELVRRALLEKGRRYSWTGHVNQPMILRKILAP